MYVNCRMTMIPKDWPVNTMLLAGDVDITPFKRPVHWLIEGVPKRQENPIGSQCSIWPGQNSSMLSAVFAPHIAYAPPTHRIIIVLEKNKGVTCKTCLATPPRQCHMEFALGPMRSSDYLLRAFSLQTKPLQHCTVIG